MLNKLHDKMIPVTTTRRVLRFGMEEQPQVWRVDANILNNQSRTAEKGGPPVWCLGDELTNPHRKIISRYEMLTQRTSDLN